ncbi:ATP-binding protein, partial [uncultured Novosphingobium sp.]|uniref:ATP-binding protein n=1 Tax=uncultured Novosphingobium sp. TaxID=292277 RepID=UPI002619002E
KYDGRTLQGDRHHETLGDPTYADAILDRLVHNAHRLEMDGESMRKTGSNTLA